MKKFLSIIILSFITTIMIGNNNLNAQKLIKKLYDDKETVRASVGPKVIKQLGESEKEQEFYYKDHKSDQFPKSGKCYIQYYRTPEKVTLIINSKITADVILAGLDDLNLDITQDFFWQMYDQFIFKRSKLSYKKVGERKSDGMHKVYLFAKKAKYKLNLNKYIKKYLQVKHFNIRGISPRWIRKGFQVFSKEWHARANKASYPVWIYKKGKSWLPKTYTDTDITETISEKKSESTKNLEKNKTKNKTNKDVKKK